MIILISGKQGSGKTTLAKALIKHFSEVPDVCAHNMFFADPLYKMHDFCWGYLKDHGIEMPFKKDGYLLQMLGTDWGRNKVDPDLWVKLMRARIDKALGLNKLYTEHHFIVSDCRFKNEFTAFPDALKIRLICDREVRKARAEMWRETEDHPSETDLDLTAEMGMFDCYYHTENEPVEDIVQDVVKWMGVKSGVNEAADRALTAMTEAKL